MFQFQFFPRSVGVSPQISSVIECFKCIEADIDSDKHDLKSNQVLKLIQLYLERMGYRVETGKGKGEKIDVPVLFGKNNSIDKCFFADAISGDGKVVIEIEAGRATENNQFLKDIFQACMMFDVEYLVLAVRNVYRGHNDYDKIYAFLETLYISSRLKLPLKGILLIGY